MAKTTQKAETAAVKPEKETKPVEKKAAAKSAKETKSTAKKPAAPKKTAAAKTTKAPAVKMILEYRGVQVSQEDILAAIKADWAGEAIKTLEIYVKPEDAAAYYVVNGEGTGKISF